MRLKPFRLGRGRHVAGSRAAGGPHGATDSDVLGVVVEGDHSEAVRALRLKTVTQAVDRFPKRIIAPRAVNFDPVVGHA